MYYVPGFSNYLEDQILSEEAPLDGGLAGSYQSLPAQQPVYSEPYYGDQYYSDPYAESYYSQPTSQPVQTAPYYGEPSYQSLPTAQPVQTEPYTETAPAGTEWVQGMDPSMRPGWQPDEAGMAELGAWLKGSPNSILNSPLYPTTIPQGAQDYIKEQAAQGKTLIYDPATEAALGSAISPFISTGVSYKPFDPNNPMANMGQVFKFTTHGDEPNAPVVFQPGQTYSLYDYKGENLLGQAKTPEELQALIDLSNQRQAQGWTLKGDNVPDYAGGGFGTGSAGGIYGRAPQDNTLKMMALAGLTAMGAGALGPFIQGTGAIAPGLTGAAATPLGAGLAAAGVNTVGNLATGASLGEALKSGALAGLSSAAMTGLLGGGGKAPNVGDMQMNALDAMNALGINSELAGQIASGPLSGIGAAGGGGLGAGGGSFVGSDALGSLITVPGKVISGNIPSSLLSGALGAATGALSGTNYGDQVFNQPSQPNGTSSDEIVVNAPKESIITAPPASLPKIIPPLSLVDIPPLAGTELPNVPEQPPETEGQGWDVVAPKENVVIAPPASLPEITPPLSSVTIPPLAGTQLPEVPQQPPETEEPGWEVVAPKENVVSPPPASLPEITPPLSSVTIPPNAGTQFPEVPEEDGWTVEAPPRAPDLLPEIIPPLSSVTIPPGAGTQLPQTPAETPATKEKSTLDKIKEIADYLQLAGLGVGAIGSLFGNGQQSAATIANAGNLGNLNPTFGAKLPGANIPGLGGGTSSAPRTAADLGQQGLRSTQDWYRYGYGPEQSFFNYVPQAQPNTSQAYTGYREGGFAVRGAGDGREDKIPAMLSDGEYVIDAETVALLGNGSNKAGADMLDKFRVNVRKHKGRELARGDFSKNAKRPEQYLAGGRA